MYSERSIASVCISVLFTLPTRGVYMYIAIDQLVQLSPKKNVKIRAYSEPLIREIAEKQIRWVKDNVQYF